MANEVILKKLEDMRERLDKAHNHAPAAKIEKRHAKGQMTARERILELLDDGSFHETDELMTHRCTDFEMDKKKIPGDGVVTGWGTIDGRQVFVFSQDFMAYGGALGEIFAKKIVKVMDMALASRCPIIGLNDSGGARIQEGVLSLGGYGDIFFRNTISSGFIPQISAILGPCAGGAVYSPAITDFTFMVRDTSYMFITGPNVIKAATGEEITPNELGGARSHATKSGVCHFEYKTETDCLDGIRKLLSYLPRSCEERTPKTDYNSEQAKFKDEIMSIIPDNPKGVYDMRKLVGMVVDEDTWFEVLKGFARNFLTGFARIGGRSVGILGNNPMFSAGCLDINASDKAARFVRFCDAFNIPMVTFVDVPGFLPGTVQEHGGIIRHGAKLLFAYSEATVPMVTIIVRKAYGGAYDAMCSKHLGCDINFAWPSAEIAVMGAGGAMNIISRKEINAADDPEAKREELVSEYEKNFSNPYKAAELGYIDAVIEPADTRDRLMNALETISGKKLDRPRKKHGNIPL